MANNKNKKLGWHFLPSNKSLGYGDARTVRVGTTLSIPDSQSVQVCRMGMHASKDITQAASFNKGPVLCRVEVKGDIQTQSDKFAGRSRKVLAMKTITQKDIDALAKHLKTSTYKYDAIETQLSNLCGGYGYGDKAEKWLRAWFDGKKAKFVPTVPDVDGKTVLSLINRRLVTTKKQIEADLKGAFTLVDGMGDDLLEAVLDDLVHDDKVLVIDGYTKDGKPGFVLAP